MGFMDEIQRYTTRLNQNDPLFGGLIPRREQIVPQVVPQMQQPMQQQSMIPPRGAISQLPPQQNQQPGIVNAGYGIRSGTIGVNPFGDKKVVFDFSRQENNRADKALEAEIDNRRQALSLNQQNLEQRGVDDVDKNDIARRKQALDEWKARNPEGQVQVVNGRVHVVNKLDGSSIDTGLAGDHINEKEKIRLGIEGQKEVADVRARNAWSLSGSNAEQAKELERLRQQNRTELASADRAHKDKIEANKPGTAVSPTQIHAAERDAASELLNRPEYAWMFPQGIVTFTPDGRLVIDRTKLTGSEKDIKDGTEMLKRFEQDHKARTQERMNVTRDKSIGSNVTVGTNAVNIGSTILTAPNGARIEVPNDKVDEAIKNGAKRQ